MFGESCGYIGWERSKRWRQIVGVVADVGRVRGVVTGVGRVNGVVAGVLQVKVVVAEVW